MKQWMQKLLEQFDVDWGNQKTSGSAPIDMNEDRATLLYILDTYNKYLIEVDKHPVRKVRETLDGFAKQIVNPGIQGADKVLFRLRQFFSSYRLDESTYIQNTFDDFKRIIWDFADQLGEDLAFEQAQDSEIKQSLEGLREAVEADSIEALRARSREFINTYIEHQTHREDRRTKRMANIKKNLNTVKKQLLEAHHTMRVDHLTQAYNRKSFEEQMKRHIQLFELSRTPVTLIMLDIDFFKKINDAYGHDIGDFVLKECVRLLKEVFSREEEFVARLGGEEFGVILPDFEINTSAIKAEEALNRIRKEVFIHGNLDIRFTVSMGLAQLLPSESMDQWLKRADTALYESKQTGRNKYTISAAHRLQKAA